MARIKVRGTIRRGMPSVAITKAEFTRRARERFVDPAFEPLQDEIGKIIAAAWNGYHAYRKAPRTRRAGARYTDPDYELSIDWLTARDAIARAERTQKSTASRSRILLVNGSSRSDQSCPGEMSKTFRLVKIAQRLIERERGFETELLDLSLLTSQYGRQILPCKACVSTAQPLCHWPCSCYPNHALGQVNDWMNEIYPSTGGKDPQKAKDLEMKGWDYPRHLAGRAFAVVVHGDAVGAETLRRILVDWFKDMGLVSAGHAAELDRYVGYYEPYATSHEALDHDRAFQEETRNAARALVQAVRLLRRGRLAQPDARLREVRPK